MKTIEYKFGYIKRDDDGFITETGIRFYEGEYVMKDGKEKYNRIAHVYSRVYSYKDFGQIKTDEELVKYLNKELKKVEDRQPIKEQI